MARGGAKEDEGRDVDEERARAAAGTAGAGDDDIRSNNKERARMAAASGGAGEDEGHAVDVHLGGTAGAGATNIFKLI